MTLDEQRNMIEHALTERMLNHAFVVLHQWAKELGFSPYIDRIQSLENNYNRLFDYYMVAEDPERDSVHDNLTMSVYRLSDEMYADMRIKRGDAPELHGFNGENINSVATYFTSCAHLQEDDLDWLEKAANDNQQSIYAIAGISALSINLRHSFQENAMMTLIHLIHADNQVVAQQALGVVVLLLAQWDVRIDFYSDLQEAFIEKIGDGERAFMMMCALVKSSHMDMKEMVEEEHITPDDLPEELKELLGKGEEDDGIEAMNHLSMALPKSEREYIQLITNMLPETWIFDLIVGEDEERNDRIERLYLAVGSLDLMWDRLPEAENWLVERLRSDKATAKDYINYGHCLFLRGDRMMAYENYREAKRLCGSVRSFFDLFRPDRKALVDNGMPLEQVYLMEDALLRQDE